MIASTLYIRTVPSSDSGDWQLLASWEKPVVQRTCCHLSTLTAVTEDSLAATRAAIAARFKAASVVDVTPPAVARALAKQLAVEFAARTPQFSQDI